MTSQKSLLRENLLVLLTVAGVFGGIILGFIVRGFSPSMTTIGLIGFPGEILMNMLKMTIVPLIAASLVSGLSQMDARSSGRIGAYAFLYYIVTMSLAVTTGIILVLIIHPGDPSIKLHWNPEGNDTAANVSAMEKIMDLLRNMFPDNIVQATFQQKETYYKETPTLLQNGTSIIMSVASQKYVNGMNVLGLIVFFIAIGLCMGHLGERVKPLADVFVSLDVVITTMVGIIMWYAPIGIGSLIAAKILEIDDMLGTARMLGMYMLTVIIGLAIQQFITLPAILYFASRKNPYIFMKGLTQAALTAIGTASSAASLPVTFKCLEENNGVDPKYTKFVLPVGAMVNMDGTALYEAVASVFIAQMNGLEMGIGTILTISITATLASIGAASIPSAGLVTMLIVLTAVGLPANDVTVIIAVDWLLDRLRTAVNVMGDGFGCGFVQAMIERRHDGKVIPTDFSENQTPFFESTAVSPYDLRPDSGDLQLKTNGSGISIRVNSNQ
ncbi:sodium:dicarboxylate symporter family domain-containing protein [Ditylenchus destructor]|uniref:Amino acid transporter n=1 Tax=Ditylenchus destructor TaxID=166010 RepID=A0AAD4NAK8_9BILA|nr:sodium:dicarboxylate symporter family domain-containing protein [Ditylenchus destructor]